MADVNWVTFPNGEAVLKRLLDTQRNPGLLLRVADTPAGKAVARQAEQNGFEPRHALPGFLTMLFEKDQPVPYTTSEIAGMIGGEITPMPRERLLSDDMVIDLSRTARKRQAPAGPDPASLDVIALNMNGQQVATSPDGRFLQTTDSQGRHEWRRESDAGQPTLWLRARQERDLASIAAGLVHMAAQGVLRQDRFEVVRDAVLEDGRLDMEASAVEDVLRQEMVRQIVARGMQDDADVVAFHAARRLSENAGHVLARASDADDVLHAGPMFLTMLRRATREYAEADFQGHDDMDGALPRLRAPDAPLQVHDLSGRNSAGVADYALNVLQRRPDRGTSVFILPEAMAEEDMETFRAKTSQAYGLECVAHISGTVADGLVAGRDVTVAFVADRRPGSMEGVPQAALRTFSVRNLDELLGLEREILRSRAQVRAFNRGEALDRVALPDDDDREENIRQRPYRPLSRSGEPFTMIPRALEGATMRALERVARQAEPHGGVDAMVANAMGCSVAELGDVLTPEQIDAVALRMNAAERGRGFLEADQTGVGKGRTMAALLHMHLRDRPRRRCLYVTESSAINVPDVLRDLKAVSGLDRFKVKLLTTGSTFKELDGEGGERLIVSETPEERRRIFDSGEWPEECDVVITTYSQFNGADDNPRPEWLANIAGDDLLLVMDEAHNALNPKANVGANFRRAIDRLPPENVIFATGTPARNPQGMDLYGPLLPGEDEANDQVILGAVSSGGQVAQEAFATMLADDGVMVRRDHDLSATTYEVALPDDQRMIEYQEAMDRFSPIVEAMIDASVQIDRRLDRTRHHEFQRMVQRGTDPEFARMRTAERTGGSMSLGSPLSNLARVTMNALKVEQMAETAIAEMRAGRKPLIVFHSTNAAVLEEASRGPDGTRLEDDALADLPPMTIRDQVRRLHGRLYMAKVRNERRDVRELFNDLAHLSERIDGLIDALPDLPVSPIDALIQRLEAEGLSTGEISGRSLCYRDGRITRRQGRDRRATVDAFNRGDIDALLYNSAGATGGSYHAGRTFLDQRPRALIEFEAPTDIIKYVQAQGRGNRYDQVEPPRVVSVMTGLTPEMRILQQRNGKLRSLGATVDGNRAHPLLLDDVPDLLNAVGDEAAANVLTASPTLAQRMGFRRFADIVRARTYVDDDVDKGASTSMGLANQLLTRSIMLPALEQDHLVRRLRMEFDVLIEDLNSRNANPLKPKELKGKIDIKATSLFQGQETSAGADTSAFHAPVHISTGVHVRPAGGLPGEKLVSMIERSVRLRGPDGLAPWGERVLQNMPDLLRPWLPEGADMARVLANPDGMEGRLKGKHESFTSLAHLLSEMKPGVQIESDTDLFGIKRTVVDVIPPERAEDYIYSAAYRIKTVSPLDSAPETLSLSQLMLSKTHHARGEFRIRPGLSEGIDETCLREYADEAERARQLPVQILGGNTLQAIGIAKQNALGTISLYRDMDEQVHRGIVVDPGKVNLKHLPVHVPNTDVLRDVARRFILMRRTDDRDPGMMRIWGAMDPKEMQKRDEADIIVRLTASTADIDMVPLRTSTEDFYKAREGLYETLHDRSWPDEVPLRAFRRPDTKHRHLVRLKVSGPGSVATRERLDQVLARLSDVSLMTDGSHRELVNACIETRRRAKAVSDARLTPAQDAVEIERTAPEPA